jgi:hypothetical protein
MKYNRKNALDRSLGRFREPSAFAIEYPRPGVGALGVRHFSCIFSWKSMTFGHIRFMKCTFRELIGSKTLIALAAICVYACALRAQTNRSDAPVDQRVTDLPNGAYSVLRETPAPQEARVSGRSQLVLAYDRRKYSDAPTNEPISYVAIDPNDYVPLIMEGAPEMTKDGEGKSILSISLTRTNAVRAEAFTRAHLGGRIAMVVDGEIITLHKIRSIITGGKLQITRCQDSACEIIKAKLVD